MKPRFPLYTKILLWFFLNLVLLMVAVWFIINLQVRSGLDSFLSGYIGQRIEPVARKIAADLGEAQESEWGDVLERYGKKYNVECVVMSGSDFVAGADIELPQVVRQHLPRGGPAGRPGPGGFGGQGGPGNFGGSGGPGDFGAERPRQDNSEAGGPLGVRAGPGLGGNGPQEGGPGGQRPDGKGLGPPPTGPLPIHEKFFLRSESPRAYWVGMIMAMPRSNNGPMRPRPMALLMRSNTFTAGGFFFDFTPWVLSAGGIVLMSVLLWLPLVRSLTRSISRMNKVTAHLADGNFEAQVDDQRSDELGQLGASINRMSTRLEDLVKGQKRFLGDVAHELCSPIARLQMALGILEQRADDKQKPYLDDLHEEVQHMSNLVNELLSFSKASLKPSEVKLEVVNILSVTQQAADREAAGEEEVRIEVPADLAVVANAELLQRALANLIRNALRYAGHAGYISVKAHREHDKVRISVKDRGPGIPEEHLDKVFDTFYRIEPSRDRLKGGAGLGLTIVKTCIECCGGSVAARNRRPNGLAVDISLPGASIDISHSLPDIPKEEVPTSVN